MLRRFATAGTALSALALGVASLMPASVNAAGPTFAVAEVGAFGGEPSITSDGHGVLYDTTPSGLPASAGRLAGAPPVYRSLDGGSTWTLIQPADTGSGDDCLATDQSNAVYWCNLGSPTESSLPLQADSWKSTVASSCGLTNCAWVHGAGAPPVPTGQTCGTSCSAFGVDRQWVAASIMPPATSTAQAEVVLMYHDFYGPSQIWVNVSQDGGRTFGAPVEVLANAALPGAAIAQAYTMCNTVPAGVQIVRPGLPHAGRIYVAWIAADLAQNATGCNLTMTQSFHTAWVAYSDDEGASWTAQQIFDAGIGHDMSTPFVAFTTDDQGNPYLAFNAADPSENPVICAAESTAGTVQSDTSCSTHTWVAWSKDGGATWNGGGGLIPGSAAAAYEVDPMSTGTDVFPTIAAGDPGDVDVAWLHTSTIVPTDPLGKFDPGGCAGPATTGNPPTFPPTCDWFLEAGQSFDVTASPSAAQWARTQVTAHPMHYGDVCNLGIFCLPQSNRHLLDFNQATIDPTTGCVHVTYADDNSGTRADPTNPSPYGNHLDVANQTSGCFGPLATLASRPAPSPTPISSPTAVSATPNTAGAASDDQGEVALVAFGVCTAAWWRIRRRRRSG